MPQVGGELVVRLDRVPCVERVETTPHPHHLASIFLTLDSTNLHWIGQRHRLAANVWNGLDGVLPRSLRPL